MVVLQLQKKFYYIKGERGKSEFKYYKIIYTPD